MKEKIHNLKDQLALTSCLVIPLIDHIGEKADRRNENAVGNLLYLQKEEKGKKGDSYRTEKESET